MSPDLRSRLTSNEVAHDPDAAISRKAKWVLVVFAVFQVMAISLAVGLAARFVDSFGR